VYRKNINVVVEGIKLPGYLLNISQEGLCFASPRPFNETVELTLEISNLYEFGMEAVNDIRIRILKKQLGIGDTLYFCKLTQESWAFNTIVNQVAGWYDQHSAETKKTYPDMSLVMRQLR